MGDLLIRDGFAAEPTAANALAPRPPRFLPGKAKHVIFLFMQGGPSHLETFDPKPLMKKYDGQLLPDSLRDFDLAQINTADAKVMAPIFPFEKHGESGLEITNLFPELARHADELAVIHRVFDKIRNA